MGDGFAKDLFFGGKTLRFFQVCTKVTLFIAGYVTFFRRIVRMEGADNILDTHTDMPIQHRTQMRNITKTCAHFAGGISTFLQ